MRAHTRLRIVLTALLLLAGCSSSSTTTSSACSRATDGHCVTPNASGEVYCDVDRGPSETAPDAAYFLTCGAGAICGIDHGKKSFSCCAPSADCVEGPAAH